MKNMRMLRLSIAAVAVAVAAPCALGHDKAQASQCADVTWRIPCSVWMNEAAFGELTGFFTSNSISGKFALFTSGQGA